MRTQKSPAVPIYGSRIAGIAKPHCEALLGTVASGRIAEVHVEQGQTVQKGDLLIALEDKLQQARVEAARIQAESLVDIELAEVHLDFANHEWERLKHLKEHASDQELKNAQLEVSYATLEYARAKREYEKACQNHKLEQLRLKDLKIYAPFTGYVTQLLKHEGETLDEQEGIVSLVQLDPLDVYLDCPLSLTLGLHVGDSFLVEAADPNWKPRMGKIVLINRVADPASQTLVVKISVANEDRGWVSGLKVFVDLRKACCIDRSAAQQPVDPFPAGRAVDSGSEEKIEKGQ
ncbi:MAG: efflux RND transporter periplasmic adaptor subunit [Planctomycetota bacterium]